MTRSALAEPNDSQDLAGLLGRQTPTTLWAPPGDDSRGVEAIELAQSIGLELDPWQQLVLKAALTESRPDKWAAFEVTLLVSRQNGKGSILEARELAGLFLWGEQLIMHSAHEFKTSQEGFRRLQYWVENIDWLRKRVKRVRTSHGDEGIELLSRQRIRFVARSGGSGRGFTGDVVVLDEAYNLPDAMVEALMPTMSARPNPQVWYTSSAADKNLAPCAHLSRVRRRGLRGGDPGLMFAEWAIDPHTEFCAKDCTEHDNPGDPASWAKANPALGIRISPDYVAKEHRSMGTAGFARERLGIGNWSSDDEGWEVISEDAWAQLEDPGSRADDPVVFAADITPDRGWGAIAVAGRRPDGLEHVELADHRAGTSWMVGRLLELQERWRPMAVVIDAFGQAGSLVAPLEEAGFTSVTATADPADNGKTLIKPTTTQVAQACGGFYEAVVDAKTLRHRGQAPLASALSGAQKRPLGEAWAWNRRGLSVDLSPLVAATLARWGFTTRIRLLEPAYDALDSIY